MNQNEKPNKLLKVMFGVTLAVLVLCLLQSKVVQVLIGLWLIAGIIYVCYKMAGSFLEGFRETGEKNTGRKKK